MDYYIVVDSQWISFDIIKKQLEKLYTAKRIIKANEILLDSIRNPCYQYLSQKDIIILAALCNRTLSSLCIGVELFNSCFKERKYSVENSVLLLSVLKLVYSEIYEGCKAPKIVHHAFWQILYICACSPYSYSKYTCNFKDLEIRSNASWYQWLKHKLRINATAMQFNSFSSFIKVCQLLKISSYYMAKYLLLEQRYIMFYSLYKSLDQSITYESLENFSITIKKKVNYISPGILYLLEPLKKRNIALDELSMHTRRPYVRENLLNIYSSSYLIRDELKADNLYCELNTKQDYAESYIKATKKFIKHKIKHNI